MDYDFEDRPKNIIGKNVRIARQMLVPAITQDDLSARLEVMGIRMDRIAISRIENGNRFVADYEVVAISDALSVSVEWLLNNQKD